MGLKNTLQLIAGGLASLSITCTSFEIETRKLFSISWAVGTFDKQNDIMDDEMRGFVDTWKNCSPISEKLTEKSSYEENSLLKRVCGILDQSSVSEGNGMIPCLTRVMHGFISCVSRRSTNSRIVA